MIKQYKIRDINKNPELHKEVVVTYSNMKEILTKFIQSAVDNGADFDKMMKGVSDE